MLERIDELRGGGRGGDRRRRHHGARSRSCACASSGARPSCPTCCAASAELPPEQRGAVGKAANQARQALEALIDAAHGASSRPPSSTRGSPPTASTSRCPATRRSRSGACTCSPQTLARDRGRLRRPRLHRRGGARGRDRPLQLRRAQPRRRRTPRATAATRSTSPTTSSCARTPRRCRSARWRPSRRRCTSSCPGRVYRRDSDATHTPQFHQVEGLRGRRGHHARRPQGHAAGLRPRDLRRRPRRAPAPALLPVHRAERRGRRLAASTATARARSRTARAATSARARAGSRSSAPGDGRPERLSARRRRRLRPRARAGLRLRHGRSSGSRCSSTACPTCGCSTRTTCASWSSSADARPRRLAARVLPTRPARPRELAERLTMTGTEVEAVSTTTASARSSTSSSARC